MDRPPEVAVIDAPTGGVVSVLVGAAAGHVRRPIRSTAWCALEVITARRPTEDDGGLVDSSVRSLVVRIGLAPNTVDRALTVLRPAGLLDVMQLSRGNGAFGRSACVSMVGVDVLHRRRQLAPRSLAPNTPLASQIGAESWEQLVLLPSF